MRYFVTLASLAILFFIGKFTYTLWIRPIDLPTPELRKLEAHFNEHGIVGHIYAVRHGFSHTEIIAVAAFQIDDYPAPFVLTDHRSTLIAERFTNRRADLPEALQPERNGTVVLDLTVWAEDSLPKANAIREVFLAYSSKP